MMSIGFTTALLPLLALLPQLPVGLPNTRCVPLRVIVDGGGPLPPSLTFELTGGPKPSSITVWPSERTRVGVLLPTDERRISIASPLPRGYTLDAFAYGAADLLREPLRSVTDATELTLRFSAAAGSWTSVSGRLSGVDLTARSYSVFLKDAAARETDSHPVQRDGSFTFPAVLSGTYSVEIRSFGGIPVSMPLVVGRDPVRGLDVVSLPQREVRGLIAKAGDVRGSFYSFSLLLDEGRRSLTITPTVASDGTFQVALPEGEHRVSVTGLPKDAVQSFTYGSANLFEQPLRLSPADQSTLTITLAANAPGPLVTGGMPYNGPGSCIVSSASVR